MSQLLCAFDRAVQHMDLRDTPVSNGLDNGTACPSCPENDRSFGCCPVRCALIKIGNKAITIGSGRMNLTILNPKRIGCSKFLGQFVGLSASWNATSLWGIVTLPPLNSPEDFSRAMKSAKSDGGDINRLVETINP